MADLIREGSRWSVAILGVALLVTSLARVITESVDSLIILMEVGLPLTIGIGLTIGGMWLARTSSAERVRQISKWAIGGGFVGVAVITWFMFINSLEQIPMRGPAMSTLNGTAIFAGAGGILGYYATGLQAREQQLERSENRFRALTENASFAVITIDQTSRIRYANDATEDLFNYPPADLIGERLTKLMPHRYHDQYLDSISEYLASETRSIDWDGFETTARRANGEEFPVEIRFGDYVVGDDHLFTGVIQDISDRKAAYQQFRNYTSKVTELHRVATRISRSSSKEQVYHRTADGAREIFSADIAHVAIADGDQLVPAASSDRGTLDQYQSVSATSGYAGQSYQLGEILRFDDISDTRSAANSLFNDGEDQPSSIAAELRAVLIVPLDEYGVMQVFDHEKTAFSERDEEVAALFASHVITALEEIETETTIQRERDRLEEFASILSHDLRNPLNVVQGRLELLKTSDDEGHIAAMDRALDRMERLIEDMLSLSREGDAVGVTEPVALRTVADRAWENVATESASLEIESSEQIDADHSRLIQVFENLYRNAVEHGGDEVTVRVGTLENGFYIEDTGPGIPEDERDNVFESGYTTEQDGTGFGLAIVKRIIEAHGWEIDLTTGRDGGARFEVSRI